MQNTCACLTETECGYQTENNGYSAKVRLLLMQFIWINIQAKLEGFLNTSAITGKRSFEQKEMLH